MKNSVSLDESPRSLCSLRSAENLSGLTGLVSCSRMHTGVILSVLLSPVSLSLCDWKVFLYFSLWLDVNWIDFGNVLFL